MDQAEPVRAFSRVPDYLRWRGHAFDLAPAGDLLQCRYADAAVAILVAMRAVPTTAGSPWLALSVPLGPAGELRQRAALVANDALGLGALADWQGLLLLRQTLPLASLTFGQLDLALRTLAHTGAQLAAAAASRAAPAPEADQDEVHGYLFR
jgi:hypothetical protein